MTSWQKPSSTISRRGSQVGIPIFFYALHQHQLTCLGLQLNALFITLTLRATTVTHNSISLAHLQVTHPLSLILSLSLNVACCRFRLHPSSLHLLSSLCAPFLLPMCLFKAHTLYSHISNSYSLLLSKCELPFEHFLAILSEFGPLSELVLPLTG